MFRSLIVILSIFFGCEIVDPEVIPPYQISGSEPNFLVIITDDQRWDALGVVQDEMGFRGRYPWFETPGFDSLASSGTRFRNAFVTTSLCSPSRASILTGKYVRINGVYGNSTPFDQPSVASRLQEAGYQTAYVGKWHMGDQSGPRPGFDYSYSFVGQGAYFDQPFEHNGSPHATYGWVDDVSTNAAINYMRNAGEQPFCLFLGFKSAHGPWNAPPDRTKNLYLDRTIRNTPNTGVRAPYLTEEELAIDYGKNIKNQDIRYMQYLKAIDDNIILLGNALEELEIADNTIVIFTSDNGFYHGEHGLRDKRTAYEESIRVPLIMSGPGIPGMAINNKLALNVDITPTILSLAGIPYQVTDFHGRNLMDSFGEGYWRTSFLYEYFKERIGPQFDIQAIRTNRYKMIWYENHPEWTELFDLQADPYETLNLFGDAKYEDIEGHMKTLLQQADWDTRR